MAEIYHNVTGRRVFDVFIEGDNVLTDLDLVEDIGAAFTAKEYVFTKEVSDGVLDILFVAKVDQAKVSGIEVILAPTLPVLPVTPPVLPLPTISPIDQPIAPPVDQPTVPMTSPPILEPGVFARINTGSYAFVGSDGLRWTDDVYYTGGGNYTVDSNTEIEVV